MPAYRDQRQIVITAAPADCFGVLTDYARMPEWQSRVCECRVLEADDAGRGSLVQYAIDAKLRVVRYQLRHLYHEPNWIGSEYVKGDFKDFAGDYRFRPQADRTHVNFSLRIDPGFKVPGAIARMLGQAVMGKSLQDLKRRVEEAPRGPQ
ncbi:MAG: SRPBCC family protein [Solirubrobacterales bacterium]|nr:SRPBCC family protein [Solirubrobacterales bacterium]